MIQDRGEANVNSEVLWCRHRSAVLLVGFFMDHTQPPDTLWPAVWNSFIYGVCNGRLEECLKGRSDTDLGGEMEVAWIKYYRSGQNAYMGRDGVQNRSHLALNHDRFGLKLLALYQHFSAKRIEMDVSKCVCLTLGNSRISIAFLRIQPPISVEP